MSNKESNLGNSGYEAAGVRNSRIRQNFDIEDTVIKSLQSSLIYL